MMRRGTDGCVGDEFFGPVDMSLAMIGKHGGAMNEWFVESNSERGKEDVRA